MSRIKDLVIRGGENLFPVQIENRLTFHAGIREAAVVSVPDAKYGEVVGAWVVREPGKGDGMTREEVRKWVGEGMNPQVRCVAVWYFALGSGAEINNDDLVAIVQNAPAWVWFLGEDGAPEELPKTASGKVQKHILRDWVKDLVGKGAGKAS